MLLVARWQQWEVRLVSLMILPCPRLSSCHCLSPLTLHPAPTPHLLTRPTTTSLIHPHRSDQLGRRRRVWDMGPTPCADSNVSERSRASGGICSVRKALCLLCLDNVHGALRAQSVITLSAATSAGEQQRTATMIVFVTPFACPHRALSVFDRTQPNSWYPAGTHARTCFGLPWLTMALSSRRRPGLCFFQHRRLGRGPRGATEGMAARSCLLWLSTAP